MLKREELMRCLRRLPVLYMCDYSLIIISMAKIVGFIVGNHRACHKTAPIEIIARKCALG